MYWTRRYGKVKTRLKAVSVVTDRGWGRSLFANNW